MDNNSDFPEPSAASPQPPAPTQAVDGRFSTDTIDMLRACAEDPMWATHAEVSKGLLRRAADELSAALSTPSPVAPDGVPVAPFGLDDLYDAMRLASLFAGSVACNDTHGAEAHSQRLRSHLAKFVVREAPPATASEAPREVALPDLPEPVANSCRFTEDFHDLFTEEQMTAYGKQCAEAVSASEAPKRAEPVATVGQGERATLLRVIQRLNQNPYSLTKGECIDVVQEMMDAAVPPATASEAPTQAGATTAGRTLTEAGQPLAALRELVALKDMKDRMQRLDISAHELETLADDYFKRKPTAWAAARAALAASGTTAGTQPSEGE